MSSYRMRGLLKTPIISLIFLQSIIIIALAGIPNHADLHTKVVNGSAASGHPQFFYPTTQQTVVEEGRDPRQWLNSYGGYGSPYMGGMGLGMWGGAELILTCLLVILGIGVIGLPFLLLIFSAFTGGQGVNFMPPTATTTVTGRKRRDVSSSLFPQMNPNLQSKLFQILDTFYKSSDKMESLKKLFDQA